MTVISPPSYLQFGAHSASSDRLTVASLLAPGATPLSTRGGVRPSGDGASLKVTAQGTPTNSVQVNSGSVFIPESSGQGVYVAHNNAPVTLTIATASTTQNRRDLVIMEVLDQEVSGSSNLAQLRVVTGVAVSGTATAPAVPTNAYPLAEVSVPAGSTTNIANSAITDRRATAVAMGGVMPALSTSLPANPYPGMEVYCSDDDSVRIWNASASLWRVQSVYPLPDAVKSFSNFQQNITTAAGTFAALPTRNFLSFTAPKPMWVMLGLHAWMRAANPSDVRATLAVSGATTGPGTSGILLESGGNFGEVLQSSADAMSIQCSMSIPFKLNAGTSTVEVFATRSSTSGTPSVNYSTIRLLPVRYA